MHPELQRIDEQYLSLYADLQAGHISQADALAVLANLTATDGEGWVWSIDPGTGNFLRGRPGEPGAPADPALFSVSRLPQVPVVVPPHGTPADQVSDYLHPNLRPMPPVPVSERAAQALGGAASGVVGGLGAAARPVAGLLKGRMRTLLVVLGAVLLAAALFAGRPGSGAGEGAESAVTSVPTATVPTPTIVIPGDDPDTTTSVAPVAGEGDVVTTEPAPLAPVPSDEELAALLELLVAGDGAALAPLLPESSRERLDLLPVLGAARGGFALSFGEPRQVGSEVSVTVRAGDPESPVRRWGLRLRRADSGAWVFVSVARA